MQNKELSQLIIEVSDALNLHPAMVEKDWYVTKAIAALSEIASEVFTLVFAGGTALAKAHRLVSRMSEDVDFKLVLTPKGQTLSTSGLRKNLSALRETIGQALTGKGFMCESANIRALNNNHYVYINLPYQASGEVSHYLRAVIKVELTVSKLQLPTLLLPVNTLVADTLGPHAEFPDTHAHCIAVMETAAEKWVALLRRTAMADRGYLNLDHTLIRHLYDLYYIAKANPLNEAFKTLVSNIVTHDQHQFRQQYPEFVIQPLLEMQRGLSLIEHDMRLKKDWEAFIAVMVFDKTIPTYSQAIASLKAISEFVLDKLNTTFTATG